MKRILFVFGGLCWFGFALGFGFFLVLYVADGAGSQFLGLGISSVSVAMGLVHVVGLVAASILCFAVGASLCAHGLYPNPEARSANSARPKPPWSLLRLIMIRGSARESGAPIGLCVRCSAALGTRHGACPECGWTQPDDHATQ